MSSHHWFGHIDSKSDRMWQEVMIPRRGFPTKLWGSWGIPLRGQEARAYVYMYIYGKRIGGAGSGQREPPGYVPGALCTVTVHIVPYNHFMFCWRNSKFYSHHVMLISLILRFSIAIPRYQPLLCVCAPAESRNVQEESSSCRLAVCTAGNCRTKRIGG